MTSKNIATTKQTEPKGRISAKLRKALTLMVEHGLTRRNAAEGAGLTDHALYCALRKPHVAALRSELMRVIRESEASRSISRLAALADGAESEHVRFKSNELLLGIDGITPIVRSQNVHAHVHTMPGLTIIHSTPDAGSDDPNVIDAEAEEITPHPGLSYLDEDFAAPGPLQVIVRSSSKVGGAE